MTAKYYVDMDGSTASIHHMQDSTFTLLCKSGTELLITSYRTFIEALVAMKKVSNGWLEV